MNTWELKKIFQSDVSSYFWFVALRDCSTNIVLLRHCCGFDKLLILVIDVSAFHRENLSIAYYWIHSGFFFFFFLKSIAFFLCLYACLWFGIAFLQTLNPLGELWGLCLISEPSIYISLFWYQFGTLTLTERKTCFYWGFSIFHPVFAGYWLFVPAWIVAGKFHYHHCTFHRGELGSGVGGVEGIPSIEIRIQFLEAGL